MSFPNKAFPKIEGDAATGLDCAAAGGTEVYGSVDYLLDGPMVQIRPGDLSAVSKGDSAVLFAILTKQILFGGHWSYVFHGGVIVAATFSKKRAIPPSAGAEDTA
jgi:hypothetical protein